MKIRSGLVSLLCLLAGSSLCAPASGQDRSYGRSVVSSPYGIVASSWVQASQAGALMLDRGGSAIDAAIATNAVLNTSEPMMNGMGGDLFAIYWDAKTGKLYGLNASGWAPQALTIEHLRAKGMTTMPAEASTRLRFRAWWMAGASCTPGGASCPGTSCSSRRFSMPTTALPCRR